ncbi:MAG: adenosylmethionine--8-amino-7-oxononanoate transaminase [Burkholderiales bacterium]|nr:adenosylmethionine--8-amino-7-oxononanoate transaminase [Burkholderiales bacterium]
MSNDALRSRSLRAVWHPCTQMRLQERLPLVPVARGEGPWLVDHDGRRIFDGISSWWTNLFGHCHPRIGAAVADQLGRLEHVMLAGCTHAPAVELAERLAALVPGSLGHCFYASDGSAAVEIALKMSFHFWRNGGRDGKTGFVALEGSYHGETLGALSVTGVALYRDTYDPLLMRCRTVASPDARAAAPGETAADVGRRAAQALEAHLAEHHASTAALIVEPLVQGAAGMVMHDPEYLRIARALCDRYDVLLIADEIMTGFGRTGTLFACEQAGVAPDIVCLSKGLTGGYLPLSAVLATDRVYGAFLDEEVARGFLHSHSYTGNPLACRAALAVLDLFAEEDVLASNAAKAARFTAALAPVAAHPRARHFRHRGMIWAFDVADAPPDFPRRAFEAALARGLLLRPLGATVYLMPPYVIEPDDFEWIVGVVEEVLGS